VRSCGWSLIEELQGRAILFLSVSTLSLSFIFSSSVAAVSVEECCFSSGGVAVDGPSLHSS
jgi:hypothetical protein